MTTESERLQILELINNGQISVEEGLRLLNALVEAQETLPPPGGEEFPAPEPDPIEPVLPVQPEPQPELITPVPPVQVFTAVEPVSPVLEDSSTGGEFNEATPEEEFIPPRETALPSDVERWKRWWMIPLFVGVGFTVLGALLMLLAWRASEFGFWFACAWLPFLLGIGVIVLAVLSSKMRWLHLRVVQPEGERPHRISISMPLPVRLISWILRVVGARSSALRERDLDKMVLALDGLSPNEPLHIEVDDEDGSHVEIFIG